MVITLVYISCLPLMQLCCAALAGYSAGCLAFAETPQLSFCTGPMPQAAQQQQVVAGVAQALVTQRASARGTTVATCLTMRSRSCRRNDQRPVSLLCSRAPSTTGRVHGLQQASQVCNLLDR